jgi:hypothetical protein
MSRLHEPPTARKEGIGMSDTEKAIPREVIEAAAKAQYEWQDGLPSWENDADGFTRAEYLGQTEAAAHIIAEWARLAALEEAEKAVMSAGDARSEKARSEQERGRSLGRDGEREKSQLAHDHAWALRNQADGLWEAAHTIRALRSSSPEGSTE